MLDIRLPEEAAEALPSSKEDMVRYLLPFVDAAIADYELSLRRRVPGTLGGNISKYEQSLLRDFLLDKLMGNVLNGDSTSPRLPVIHEMPSR